MRAALTPGGNLRQDLTVASVLLAAGSGARIGNRPKCLLKLDGESLLRRQLRALANCGVEEIVVVLGHYAEYIEPILTEFQVTLVHNPNPDAGQNSSLHCGLRALSQHCDAVLVALADQPLLAADDIGDLLRAFIQRPRQTSVVVPTVNDLPGNPVMFSVEVGRAILMRDEAFGCKQWQIANPKRVYRWQTTNERYRIDIDTLEDIEMLAARSGQRLHWPSSHSSS